MSDYPSSSELFAPRGSWMDQTINHRTTLTCDEWQALDFRAWQIQEAIEEEAHIAEMQANADYFEDVMDEIEASR